MSLVADSEVALQVVPLAAGYCLNFEAITQRGGKWKIKHFPAGYALLVHPQRGPILFDTGYGALVPQLMRRWPALLYGLLTPVRLQSDETAANTIRRLGFGLNEVQHIILSHFHADHVGGVRDFPAARFCGHAAAYQSVKHLQGVAAVRKAFLPELLPEDFAARWSPLTFQPAPPELKPFLQYADVFGDGSLLALPVEGHAVGMIALLVRSQLTAQLANDGLANGGAGWYLLAADAAWSVQALRHGYKVHPLAHLAFADVQQERKSATQLRDFWQRHPNLQVIVSHDTFESYTATGSQDV